MVNTFCKVLFRNLWIKYVKISRSSGAWLQPDWANNACANTARLGSKGNMSENDLTHVQL